MATEHHKNCVNSEAIYVFIKLLFCNQHKTILLPPVKWQWHDMAWLYTSHAGHHHSLKKPSGKHWDHRRQDQGDSSRCVAGPRWLTCRLLEPTSADWRGRTPSLSRLPTGWLQRNATGNPGWVSLPEQWGEVSAEARVDHRPTCATMCV